MTHPQVVALPQLVTVPDVEIVAAGTWKLASGEATFTSDDLAAAVQATQCPAIGSPKLKLGHVDPRFDGEPTLGIVSNLRLASSGAKISGDLAGMPAWLAAALPSAYPNRSIEGMYGYTCQIGHTHPFVITHLALLGVTAPGVGVLSTLKDVAALYGVEAAAGDPGSTWTLRLGEVMADAAPSPATTVEDIRRAYYDNPATPPTMWITEIQLAPLQMIVADEAQGTLCRVPVKIGSDGTVSFGTPVPVQVSYVDSPEQKTAASAAIPVGRALAVAARLRGIPVIDEMVGGVVLPAMGTVAASAAPRDADAEYPEYSQLYGTVEEGRRRADEARGARRNEVAAMSDDDLYASLFPPAARRTAAPPVAASATGSGGQRGQGQARPQQQYRVRVPHVSLRIPRTPNGLAAGADPAKISWRTVELRAGDLVPLDAHPNDVEWLRHRRTSHGPFIKQG